ncbi:MAG: hypothetical protein FWH27_01790 [Planctomycetaceae bacterium]|nr:hypothetical protein [Planctomycetaceae bacterium]
MQSTSDELRVCLRGENEILARWAADLRAAALPDRATLFPIQADYHRRDRSESGHPPESPFVVLRDLRGDKQSAITA